MSCPGKEHVDAAKQVIRYLFSTTSKDYGITYSREASSSPHLFVHTRKSGTAVDDPRHTIPIRAANFRFYLHLILKTLDGNLTNFLRIHRAKSGATLMRYFKPVLNPKEKLLWIDRNIDFHFSRRSAIFSNGLRWS